VKTEERDSPLIKLKGAKKEMDLMRNAKKTFPQFIFRAKRGRKIAGNIRLFYSYFSVN